MGDKTKIEWSDATWTPIRARYWELQNDGGGKERIGWHCEHASEGCRNCYSEGINLRLGTGLPFKPDQLMRSEKIGYNNGESVLFLDEKMLAQPLRWKKPRMIFVCSMTDLFADFVPDDFIDRIFAVMALCPQHTFQVLTKRPERAARHMANEFGAWPGRVFPHWAKSGVEHFGTEFNKGASPLSFPLPNVWVGFSAEDQKNFEVRHEALRPVAEAGWLTWCSAEPLLGQITVPMSSHISWLVSGGESGPRARPAHPDWFRLLRHDCAAAGIPYLHKQNGAFVPVVDRQKDDPDWHLDYSHKYAHGGRYQWLNVAGGMGFHGERFHVMERVGKHAAGRLLDGVIHDGYPNQKEIAA